MTTNSNLWTTLRHWARTSVHQIRVDLLVTSVVLPCVEAIFVNLLTSATSENRWPFAIALVALAILHVFLVGVALWRDKASQLSVAVEALHQEQKFQFRERELTSQVSELTKTLQRQKLGYRMIREAIDAFNFQTCQLDPTDDSAFQRGLEPIIQKVTCNIRSTLGVTSNEFTIEVMCLPWASQSEGLISTPDVALLYFYSSQKLDFGTPFSLSCTQTWEWGLPRKKPGICRVDDDKELFEVNGRLCESLYFKQFATVPIRAVCSDDQIGVLILTSMQEVPFSEDILDAMQFLASIISQHIASHNRCVEEFRGRAFQSHPATTISHTVDRLYATEIDHTTGATQEIRLDREGNDWRGGTITVQSARVVVDGAEFPLTSGDPVHAQIHVAGKTIEITE